MPTRKKSNLNLHRRKKYKVIGVKSGVKAIKSPIAISKLKFFNSSPIKSGCLKRLSYPSPNTPTFRLKQSPCQKKLKKSLYSPQLSSGSRFTQYLDTCLNDDIDNSYPSPNTPKFRLRPSPCKKRFKKSLYSPQLSSGSRSTQHLDSCLNDTIDNCEDFGITPIQEEQNSEHLNTILDILPRVLEKLSVEGFDKSIIDFLKLVDQDRFPLTNIAFILWTEVIKWYDCTFTTAMRYSTETKMFWKLGYRVFGGKFLSFMSGFKCKTQSSAHLNESATPSMGEINFAVPDSRVLRSFQPYNMRSSEDCISRKPGLLTDMIETLASTETDKSYCLTFDGKKLKQGLKSSSGNVDLLGFEKGPSLAEKKQRLSVIMTPVEDILNYISNLDTQVEVASTDMAPLIIVKLRENLQILSQEVFDARNLKKKKEYAKEKLIERGGDSNWRNGRFSYAVFAMIAFIHDIDEFVNQALDVIGEIVNCISYMNTCPIVNNSTLNVSSCDTYAGIDELMNIENENTTRLVKQRTDEWTQARAGAMFTGSTMFGALGLDGLQSQKQHFDKVICKLPEKEFSEEAKIAMRHGTENESNAMATFVGKVLPIIYPGCLVCEEGFVEIKENIRPFMIISPDGSVRRDPHQLSSIAAIELKCPINDIHEKIPVRYLTQCLSEIEALDVDELIYLSWKPEYSTVFVIKRNKQLFKLCYDFARQLYMDQPKRPTKTYQETRHLREKIVDSLSSNDQVQFLGIVPSVLDDSTSDCTGGEMDVFRIPRFKLLMEDIINSFRKFYELNREPASEVVVFLCCDLDRQWESNVIQSGPVCWFPKGYSLDTNTMRDILEAVLNNCKDAGIHIPSLSFDGQWHNICVRSTSEKPLTLLQLQRDVWKKVEATKKPEMIKYLRECNTTPSWKFTVKDSDDGDTMRIITATYGVPVPCISESVGKQRRKEERGKKVIVGTRSEIDALDEIELSETNATNFAHPQQNFETTNHLELHNGDENDRDINERDSLASNDKKVTLDLTKALNILKMLRTDKKANCQNQWNEKAPEELIQYMSNSQQMNTLKDADLKIVVRFFNKYEGSHIKESLTKYKKVSALCEILGVPSPEPRATPQRRRKEMQVKSLKDLTLKAVSKHLRKSDLNIVFSEHYWPNEFENWTKQHPVPEINDLRWFYAPNFSECRNQLEVSCVDSTHLLTRTRRKSCRGGLDGLSNTGWRNVAMSKTTKLSLAMIDCVFEPMSVCAARTHFSENVEAQLMLMGHKKEADLCKVVRSWWIAEDDRGISAVDRFNLRIPLREKLLAKVKFSCFPPPGMYVDGWPTQLWEAILANIDSKTILYRLSRNQTYNVRAFSSMMGETYFSEMTLNDKRGHGTLTVDEVGQSINTSVEQLHMRMDPNRKFAYRTSRRPVYDLIERIENSADNNEPDHKDHTFDIPSNRRSKQKELVLDPNRNAVKRGTLGVRWESARRNESKLLLTTRLGIDK